MKEQYSLHVEFMVAGSFPTGGWYNIFHATLTDKDNSRVPGIWIQLRNGKMRTVFFTVVGENKNYFCASLYHPIRLNKWITINVSQTKVGGGYQYIVEMNGKVLQKKKNTNPRQFENVKIYMSNPWYSPVPGYVRNVYLKGKV